MFDLDFMFCPFCGGEMDERGGQCSYNKKTMTIDLKCKQCETIIKFKTKWQNNPYKEAIEAFNHRSLKDDKHKYIG